MAEPAFPRATAFWWFGCKSASRGTLGNIAWNNNYSINDTESGNLDTDAGGFLGDDSNPGDDVGDIIFDAGT